MQPLTIFILTVALVITGMSLLVASEQEGESSAHPEVVRTQPIPQPLIVRPIDPAAPQDDCPPGKTSRVRPTSSQKPCKEPASANAANAK